MSSLFILPRGGIFGHFVYVYSTWGPVTWGRPLVRAPLCNLILVLSQHRWLNSIGQKKAHSHSLAITRDMHSWDREKSSGQAHLFYTRIIGAMDRTSGQPRVKLSWLRSNSLKFQPDELDPSFRLVIWYSVTTFTLVSIDGTQVNSTLLYRE